MPSNVVDFGLLKSLAASEDWGAFLDKIKTVPALIKSEDLEGNTLLLLVSSMRGAEDAMRLLIEKGADVDHKNNIGLSSLESALYSHKSLISAADRVKILLDAGITPNYVLASGWRALQFCVARGHVELVKILMSYGADPWLKSEDPHPVDSFALLKLSSHESEIRRIISNDRSL